MYGTFTKNDTSTDSSVYSGPKTDYRFAHWASRNGQSGQGLIYSWIPLNCTGNLYKAVPRLQECCWQVEAEVVSNSKNKIHQTWERPYRDSLVGLIATGLAARRFTESIFSYLPLGED